MTLKNKWLCHLQPPVDAEPLAPGVFPLCSGSAAVDVPTITGLPTARVAATDKVVTVPVGTPPAVKEPGPPRDLYEKEWTYGEALAFVERERAGVVGQDFAQDPAFFAGVIVVGGQGARRGPL